MEGQNGGYMTNAEIWDREGALARIRGREKLLFKFQRKHSVGGRQRAVFTFQMEEKLLAITCLWTNGSFVKVLAKI